MIITHTSSCKLRLDWNYILSGTWSKVNDSIEVKIHSHYNLSMGNSTADRWTTRKPLQDGRGGLLFYLAPYTLTTKPMPSLTSRCDVSFPGNDWDYCLCHLEKGLENKYCFTYMYPCHRYVFIHPSTCNPTSFPFHDFGGLGFYLVQSRYRNCTRYLWCYLIFPHDIIRSEGFSWARWSHPHSGRVSSLSVIQLIIPLYNTICLS